MKQGILFGVSVGPGDPELMTLKAVRILNQVSVVAVPKASHTLAYDIACQVVDLSQKELIYLEFLMVRDREKMEARHKELAETLLKKLRQGEDVAMLNLGDASLYATFSYIAKLVEEAGFPVEVVAGVNSFSAVAATLEVSLTTLSEPLHILPSAKIQEILPLSGNKVVMKTGKAMATLKAQLREHPELEVMAVQNCGLKDEKICRSLEEISDDASYFTTLIVKGGRKT